MCRDGCQGFRQLFRGSRRDLLRVGSLSGIGLSLGDYLGLRAGQMATATGGAGDPPAKSVIQIVLQGGISGQESWSPKPEAPLDYRGPLGVVKTPIPGVVFSEVMKQCATVADKMCVVRSLVGNVPDHGLGMYNMLTGNQVSPAIKHPSIGAVVSHELGNRNSLPGYIGVSDLGEAAGVGYLSPQYGPFPVGGNPGNVKNFRVRDLRIPEGVGLAGIERRRGLRDLVNASLKSLEADPARLDAMDAYYDQAYTMMTSDSVRGAFDLASEPEEMLERYGIGKFLQFGHYGQSLGSMAGGAMLLCRRLVEAGARFVSMAYMGWDTHNQIREVYQQQMPAFDHALAALLTDLDERGLLDSTLVWVATEFGRTPKINAGAGRDHWSRVFPMALAGGGLKRGLIYGDTDATASDPARDAVRLADLHSTIYRLLGIDSDTALMAPGDRPIQLIRDGKPVRDLIA